MAGRYTDYSAFAKRFENKPHLYVLGSKTNNRGEVSPVTEIGGEIETEEEYDIEGSARAFGAYHTAWNIEVIDGKFNAGYRTEYRDWTEETTVVTTIEENWDMPPFDTFDEAHKFVRSRHYELAQVSQQITLQKILDYWSVKL